MRNRHQSIEDVFTSIYQENQWGGEPGEYCSGSGSTEEQASNYASRVRAFIGAKGITSVVDLGCGDFVVGSRLVTNGIKYIGVDVVAPLVHRNLMRFASENVTFVHADITKDPLPDADLCLLRQVLQHLSNAEIEQVLEKTEKYKYILVTEHYPSPSVGVVPNKDKPHGADTRIYDNSAVFLDRPPFNARISGLVLEVIASRHLVRPGETIRTFLLENSH
jgi:SAM-dependent methyltransferase